MAPLVVGGLQIVGLLAAAIAVAVLVKLIFFGTAPARRKASADAEVQAHQNAVRSQIGGFGPPSG